VDTDIKIDFDFAFETDNGGLDPGKNEAVGDCNGTDGTAFRFVMVLRKRTMYNPVDGTNDDADNCWPSQGR